MMHPSDNEENLLESAPTLGFWLYLMSDCLLFAALFATFAVLRGNAAAGPSAEGLFNLPYVLWETTALLTSSFFAGLGFLALMKSKKNLALAGFATALLLGFAFLELELREFLKLIAEGAGPGASGFLSSYFALVGTHGLHVALGSVWMIVALWQLWRRGITPRTAQRLTLVSLFWHFLDIIWIFIFTFVYLFSAI